MFEFDELLLRFFAPRCNWKMLDTPERYAGENHAKVCEVVLQGKETDQMKPMSDHGNIDRIFDNAEAYMHRGGGAAL